MGSHAKRRRHKAAFSRRTPPGAPPGVLVGDPSAPRPQITVFGLSAAGHEETEIRNTEAIPALLQRWPFVWINVDGLGDAGLVQELGAMFDLHRLALEDVLHVHQRAKAESYADVLFVVAPMPMPGRGWEVEQLSLFVGRNFLITFQERPGGDCLEQVRVRLRAGLGRARCLAPGYLMYALLDAAIDHYFPLLEEVGERLDALEGDILGRPRRDVVQRILDVKRDLRSVRRAVWPLRDALNTLLRDPNPLVADETRVYLRDCHDHVVQIIDLLENYRELAGGLTDIYLSNLSNSTNEIMKVLTIISTLFIPLTFIVGVYGMNFATDKSPWNMPELGWYYGYPFVLALMAAIALGLFGFFIRKGWIGSGKSGGGEEK
ncbi:MAG: magnesium/cobalt transporter CorA [Planctomycetes bacterium]|nr:magnesium/cobalt transporter CorA [Planctomycetota bacterium]